MPAYSRCAASPTDRGTNALSALGASETSAGHAVLLLSLFPPLAAVLASVFLRERLTVLRVVAILIGVVGAMILTLSKSGAGSSLAGDAMIGGLILTWAFLQLGIRKLDTTYPALFVVGVFGTIGCLLLTGMGLVAGRIDAIFIPLITSTPLRSSGSISGWCFLSRSSVSFCRVLRSELSMLRLSSP